MDIPKAREYLDVLLSDDVSPVGGISHLGETLGEYLDSVGISHETPIYEVNEYLKECGIIPIEYK